MADTDFDPYQMLAGDDASVQEKAKAMAAALRGQRYWGDILSSSTNPTLASSGQSMLGQAQHQQQALDQMIRERPSYQESLVKLSEAKRMNAMRTDPSSPMNQYTGQIVSQLGGPALPQGVSAMDIPEQTLGLLERQWAARQRADALRDVAATRAKGRGGGAGAPALDDNVLTVLANNYASGLGMPKGRAMQVPSVQQAIIKRALELHPDLNPALAGANLHAGTASLVEAQKLADATDVNEGKALADIGILESTMKPIFDSRSPLINAVGRKLQENSGDPQVAQFLTARQAALAQINKVLNAGTLTESARHEAEELLKKDASLAQIRATLDVLKQDMARSREAMHKRVTDTQARLGGRPATPDMPAQQAPSGTAPASAGVPPGSPPGTVWLRSTGDGGKTRILGTPDGKPLPGAKSEPNPNYKPPAVASRG